MARVEEIETIEMEYERTHTKCVRYKVVEEDQGHTFAKTLYVEKDSMPDPRKPPKRIRVAIQFLK